MRRGECDEGNPQPSTHLVCGGGGVHLQFHINVARLANSAPGILPPESGHTKSALEEQAIHTIINTVYSTDDK